MITNKDIRVENGFLIINGDKYPLDGQSPEAIMEIVENNSDSTPTENSTAPVTSGGVYTALAGKCSVATYDWVVGNVTADTVYTLSDFQTTVGLSGKTIVAVGIVFAAGSSDYDYGAGVVYRSANDFVRLKASSTQNGVTARLYIIYTD